MYARWGRVQGTRGALAAATPEVKVQIGTRLSDEFGRTLPLPPPVWPMPPLAKLAVKSVARPSDAGKNLVNMGKLGKIALRATSPLILSCLAGHAN